MNAGHGCWYAGEPLQLLVLVQRELEVSSLFRCEQARQTEIYMLNKEKALLPLPLLLLLLGWER